MCILHTISASATVKKKVIVNTMDTEFKKTHKSDKKLWKDIACGTFLSLAILWLLVTIEHARKFLERNKFSFDTDTSQYLYFHYYTFNLSWVMNERAFSNEFGISFIYNHKVSTVFLKALVIFVMKCLLRFIWNSNDFLSLSFFQL